MKNFEKKSKKINSILAGIADFRRKLFKSEFAGNLLTQITGTFIAQALPVILMPLLSRIYSENDFGVFSSFFAYSAVLIVATGGRYYIAIVLPKEESDGHKLFYLSIVLTTIYSVILFFVSLVIFYGFDFGFGSRWLILIVPLYVFLFGIWQSFFYLSLRYKHFRSISVAKITQAVTYSVIGLVLGYFHLHSGLILGRVSGVLASIYQLKHKLKLKESIFDFRQLKAVAITYIDYPKYNIIPTLLDTISVQSPILMIGYYYSRSELGFYAFTELCLVAPLGLVGVSFRDVFYQKITRLINEKRFTQAKSFFFQSTLFLSLFGFLGCVVLFAYGEVLFSLVFGQQWAISGQFASILSFSFLVKLVVSPLSCVLNSTDNIKIASLWQAIYFISTLSTMFFTIHYIGADIYLLLKVYVVHEVVLYAFYYFLQFNSFNKYANQMQKTN